MDEESDNSEMPITIVGESIAVGVVLKNPLKGVPLLMTNLCLVWDATPAKCTTPSSLSPSASAVCEIVKHVLLQPEEERMVTLHMTPLKEGELVVKGFIYNLCIESNQSCRSSSPLIAGVSKANSLTLSLNSRDSLYQVHQGSGFQSLLAEGVQGRVELEVRGPRLNDSKREKASLVYKKDYRLHWRVTPPMPKIVTALSGLPTFMLTGELTRVGVEVFNVGQVALNSLRLTSSLGPQLLLDEVSSELHHCPIYPSTLLSPLGHSPGSSTPVSTPSLPSGTFSPCCLELPLPQSRLEPGKRIRTKLVMQGTPFLLSSSGYGAGEIPWNIVFYYEPALISANSRLSHRVLRHSCILHVRESLQLRATAIHSLLPRSISSTVDGRQRIDLNQLVITLEAENKCQLTHSSAVEMRISQISCMSRKWRVYKLDRNQGLLCLLPSENGVIHLKGSLLEYSTSSVRVHSDVPLGSTIIPSHLFPVKDLFSGRDGVSSLGIDSGQDTCTRSEGGGERNSEEEIVLIVFWQALVPTTGSDTLFSYGHHTITVPLPQSMSALRESVQPPSPYDLVKFHLEHPITYHHRGFVKTDIAATPPDHENSISSLCRVPVKIVLQNCHHQVVKAMVELLQPKDGTHQDPKRYSEISLFWSGGCKRQIKLEASSSRTLSVFANFCWPGVYNLNTLRVLAARGDSSNYHVQRW